MPERAEFESLPLEEQLRVLRSELTRSTPEELLTLCAALHDPAPLVWLCSALLEAGHFNQPESQERLSRFLLSLPDISLDKIVKGLIQVQEHRESLKALLLSFVRNAPLERLPAMCLVDRAFKQSFTEEWEAHLVAQEAKALSLLQSRQKIEPSLFAQLSSKAIEKLSSEAALLGLERDFECWHHDAAAKAISVLREQPKGVSQANAEELLSRRVYTDPGHFLIELLQNAEDAGAKHWRVTFEPSRIIIWHDGSPFDMRDLVGVTSIGQTTKRKQQIGFFGVGFKSVYEITERPQLYSGAYELEIVDVSIPKPLSGRPTGVPKDGTVLVLPLRDPNDADRNASALYERARALDPCVLFTLRNMERITLEHTESKSFQDLRENHTPRGAFLRQQPDGWTREYLLQEAEHQYPGSRVLGRPDRTRVMVGIAAQGGVPKPIDANSPTAYSYLPTAEQTGLRFFIQGHFDVPVDRERLNAESPWNQWIIEKLPSLLAKIAKEISERPLSTAKLLAAKGVCEILPLPSEIKSPLFARLPEELSAALSEIAILPSTDRALHSPNETWVAEPALASLFREVSLGGRYLLEPSLPQRTREVALLLGAKPLDADSFLLCLENSLSNLEDGQSHAGWAQFLAEKRERLYDLLLGELERREREENWDGVTRWLERVRALPLLTATDSTLYRASSQKIVRGSPALRALYQDRCPLLDERLDISCAQMGRPKPSSRTTLFLDRIGVSTLEVEDALKTLEREANQQDQVEGPSALPFLGSEERRRKAIELFASASMPLQTRAIRLPLFLTTKGDLRRAAKDASDTQGALWTKPGKVGERLREYYQGARPVLSTEACAAEEFLLERLRVPALDLETFTYDLSANPKVDDLQKLHSILEELREEMPARPRAILAQLPIWLDREGVGRPLVGEGAALLSRSYEVISLFEGVPFLHDSMLKREHLIDFGAREVKLDDLVAAFSSEAKAPLALQPTKPKVEKLLTLLLKDTSSLSQRGRALLWQLPLSISDEGALCRPSEMRLVGLPALQEFFRGVYQFLPTEGLSAQVLEAVGLLEHIKKCDVEELIELLSTLSPQLLYRQPEPGLPLLYSQARLDTLLSFLGENAQSFTRNQLLRCKKLAIYPDPLGRLAYLGDFRRELDREGSYPCEPSVRPLWTAAGLRPLAQEAQEKLAPFLEAIGIPSAGAEAAVELMRRRLQKLSPSQPATPLQSPENLARLQTILLTHKEELSELYPTASRPGLAPGSIVLCRLPLWRTMRGAVVSADEVIDPKELTSLFNPGTPEYEALSEVTLDTESLERLRALSPLLVPAPKERPLAQLVAHFAKEKAPLSSQANFLSSVAKVSALYETLRTEEPQHAPLVDALERLRTSGLFRADEETSALLRGTHLGGDLAHLEFCRRSEESKLPNLPLSAVLQALQDDAVTQDKHPLLKEAWRREAFYRWLLSHEPQLFSDALCRELLAQSRLFPSERGALLRPSELHFDSQLPSLEIDCRPHPEIPQEARELLQRHLGAGRLSFDELLRLHVVPAYQAAVNAQMPERARGLFSYAAKQLQGATPPEILKSLLFEDQKGRFQPISTLLLPEQSLLSVIKALWGDEYPIASPQYAEDSRRLLLELGVSALPREEKLQDALTKESPSKEQSLALAELVGYLSRHAPELLQNLPLRRLPWILDGAGCLRRPDEVYLRDPELEALVGDFTELFADPQVVLSLGESYCRELGFRRPRDVSLDEVVRQIEAKQGARSPLSFRVYQWLEQGIENSWLEPGAVLEALEGKPWVYSDDGIYCYSDKVLGIWAFSYFGDRRGYWERGRESCPKLCRLFSIPFEVNGQIVSSFLEEIGREAVLIGDQALFTKERALPRMLSSCYALLGRDTQVLPSRNLPFVLCQTYPVSQEAPRYRLLRADALGLYRSDTPTLEALFGNAGTLYLAAQGNSQDRESIERFYQAMGIRQLREAYQISVAEDAGQDRSEAYQEHLFALRGILRAFFAVLPRIKKQRAFPSEHWVFEERLRPLAAAGGIRAIEQLRARYQLPGVGQSFGEVPAIYDVARGELFVDTRTLDDPDGALSGMALGLMPSFYQGPGEEQLIDLCEILLPLRTRERMSAYLDRRHFPVLDVQTGPKEQLAERLGELLDFGIVQRLAPLVRFDLSPWRDPRLTERLGEGELPVLARRLVTALLDSIQAPYDTQLIQGLMVLLTLPSLRQLPQGLLQSGAQQEGFREYDTPPDGNQVVEVQDEISLEGVRLPELPLLEMPPLTPPLDEEWQPVELPTAGIWQRFLRWVRGEPEGPPVYSQPPPWAADGANALQPSAVIPPQLWATPQNRARIAQQPSRAKLVYAPPRLPMPHLYAAYTLGVRFDAATQSWSSVGAPPASIYAQGRPTGRNATFQGRIMAGTTQLPLPLYSRLTGPITASNQNQETMFSSQPDPSGAFQARLQTEQPVLVRFEVELLEPPTLSDAPLSLPNYEALVTPTMPLRRLPLPVQRWLEQEGNTERPPWTRALAVREFIKSRYRYQDDFLEREDVKQAINALRPGDSNHHLTLLHASADAEVLGYGICYELNILAVELLRHLQIPSMVATGWIFDLGEVDRPDHLFALALLSTNEGVAMMPIDASTNSRGPIRPLGPPQHSNNNPIPQTALYPEPTGPWNANFIQTPLDWRQQLEELRANERQRLVQEATQLSAVIQSICRVYRVSVPVELEELTRQATQSNSSSALPRLWELARQLLPQQELLSSLLSVERGECSQISTLTPALQELVRRGLVRVRTVPFFQVLPTRNSE